MFRLPGGSEDHDLWASVSEDDNGTSVLCSTWEPTAEERQAIADGANIELVVWGGAHPPVSLATTTVPLGKAPIRPPV